MWWMQLLSNISILTAHCSWMLCFRNWSRGTLLQNGQPVILISQTLTDTQKRYSNIKRELLAMVMVIEKLHHYIFGRHLMVHTDHSPLVSCLKNVWMIPYHDFKLDVTIVPLPKQVKYITHKCIPIADCMSRLVNLKSGVEDPTLNLQIADVTKPMWTGTRSNCPVWRIPQWSSWLT